MTGEARRFQARDIAMMAAIVVLSLALHGSAIRGWWMNDDPQIVIQAIRQSPLETWFEPSKWQSLSSSNFTPLVTLSFEADLAIAGVSPGVYYAHHLVSLVAAALLLFVLLRCDFGNIASAAGSVVFLATPVVAVAARTLMVRHYIEGLVLAFGALIFWRRGVGREQSSMAGDSVSGVLYLFATLAKEIYAPLPLVLAGISLAHRERGRRIGVRLLPHVVAALVYLFWRARMTGELSELTAVTTLQSAASFANQVLSAIFGSVTSAAFVLFLAVLILGVIAGRRRHFMGAGLLVASIAVALVLPLVAVVGHFENRYAFGCAAGVAVAIAAGLDAIRDRRALQIVLACAMAGAMMYAGIKQGREYERNMRPMVAEGQYVWLRNESAPLLLAESPGWYLEGLEWMREVYLERGVAPDFVLSTTGISLRDGVLPQIVSVDRASKLVSIEDEVVKQVMMTRARFDPSIPIELSVSRGDGALSWSLAPADASRWSFLSLPNFEDYPIPSRGRLLLPFGEDRGEFCVRRELANGRWNVTPVLALPKNGESLRWKSR